MIAIAAGMKFTSSAKKKSSNEKTVCSSACVAEVQFQLPTQVFGCPNKPGRR